MVRMDRQRCGIAGRIFNTVRLRRGNTARRDDEGFDAEATDEPPFPIALVIGIDVALIPRHTKWAIRMLDHEEIEVGICRGKR